MSLKKIKKFLYECFHHSFDRKAKVVNGVISFLIIFSIAIIPLHFITAIEGMEWMEPLLFLFDKIVVTIFTIEYLLRIWTARNKIKFIFSWEGIVDLVSILPFYLDKFSLLGDIGYAFEMFLMLRILRVLRFTTMYGAESQNIDSFRNHGKFYKIEGEQIERVVQKHPLVLIAGLVLPLILTSSGLISIMISQSLNWNGWINGLSVLFFSFAVVFFIKAWLDFNYDIIYITTHRVILQNHELFGSETNGLIYESITNVIPNNRGFFRWALGLGHIEIETANRDATIIFESVRHPHNVVKHISENRIKRQKQKDRQKEELKGARETLVI